MKKRIAAIAVVLTLPLTMASKCTTGPSAPNAPATEGPGRSACEVTKRAENSKGQMVLSLHCYDDQNDVNSAVIIGPNQYPDCIEGTFWPGCK
jgi:hypothetical protein